MKKSVIAKKTMKAKEYGYGDEASKKLGKAHGRFSIAKTPVAKDTNKTRRPRALPMKRGK
jgi:hypothetical protein